jgi:hypothetical protein
VEKHGEKKDVGNVYKKDMRKCGQKKYIFHNFCRFSFHILGALKPVRDIIGSAAGERGRVRSKKIAQPSITRNFSPLTYTLKKLLRYNNFSFIFYISRSVYIKTPMMMMRCGKEMEKISSEGENSLGIVISFF